MTIAEVSVAARKAGMTYGQYVALHKPAGSGTPEQRTIRKCDWCGCFIPRGGLSDTHYYMKRYCSFQCKEQASYERKKAKLKGEEDGNGE